MSEVRSLLWLCCFLSPGLDQSTGSAGIDQIDQIWSWHTPHWLSSPVTCPSDAFILCVCVCLHVAVTPPCPASQLFSALIGRLLLCSSPQLLTDLSEYVTLASPPPPPLPPARPPKLPPGRARAPPAELVRVQSELPVAPVRVAAES